MMKRNKAILMTVLAAALFFSAGYWVGESRPRFKGDTPIPNDLNRSFQGENTNRSFDDLMERITLTQRAVELAHWEEALHQIGQVRAEWHEFKPAMQAGGGMRMWSSSDVQDFDRALAAVEGAISFKNGEQATDALNKLTDIAAHHDDTIPRGRRTIDEGDIPL